MTSDGGEYSYSSHHIHDLPCWVYPCQIRVRGDTLRPAIAYTQYCQPVAVRSAIVYFLGGTCGAAQSQKRLAWNADCNTFLFY